MMQIHGQLADVVWTTATVVAQEFAEITEDRDSAVTFPWMLTSETFLSQAHQRWPGGIHRDHELIFSTNGTLTVEIQGRLWIAPPGLGIWIPAGQAHHVTTEPGTVAHVTYFATDRISVPWEGMSAIGVTTLIRELILANKNAELTDEVRARVQRLVCDLLAPVRTMPLEIRMPADPALRIVAEEILRDPANNGTSADWGKRLGVSGRTVNRGFDRETGSTLTQWRIRVRIRRALIDIAAGHSVASIAHELGYANPSTFIQLFKQTTGYTPAAYFKTFENSHEPTELEEPKPWHFANRPK
ncbi:helix-turn-helix domain-containing protein [Glutamicibacter sp. NPDC087344]|uniref:helix-turn-helix domain-containing protein n=1 Tax=Glutamicibacter sp. NPDC087344 TaxID=3363994 RepID=UPI003801E90D